MYTDDNVKVVYPQAKLIAHTPDPEKVVALAAKLCYSNTDPDKIYESLTDEEVAKYLSHLNSYGHESPVEHASFTFLITGMSRSCLAQFTRHRIASFSVQSQRYIDFSNFSVTTPEYVEYPVHDFNDIDDTIVIDQNEMQSIIDAAFANAMGSSKELYKELRDSVLFMLVSKYICDHVSELFEDETILSTICEGNQIFDIHREWFEENGKPRAQAVIPNAEFHSTLYTEGKLLESYKFFFMENTGFRKYYNKATKIANENARCVLPNACTCNMVVTMNARELRHFFTLRCCNRAQAEIRSIAWQMRNQCCNVAPNLFKDAGPSCLRNGCSEGSMTCGKPYSKAILHT